VVPQLRASHLIVIPAQAGLRRQDAEANIRAANGPKGKLRMQFVIQLFSLAFQSKTSTRPADERVTFLHQRRKVTKRRRPRHRTFAARKCPALLGTGGPARTRASLRSDMRAFPPPSPAMLGAVKGEENQKPGQEQRRAVLLLCSCPCFCAQERAALASPGPHCIAAAAVGKALQGAARGIAPIPLSGQGRAVNGTRPLTRTRSAGCAQGAMLWGVFLLVTFLCTSKEKLPARLKGEWKLLLLKPKIKSNSRPLSPR